MSKASKAQRQDRIDAGRGWKVAGAPRRAIGARPLTVRVIPVSARERRSYAQDRAEAERCRPKTRAQCQGSRWEPCPFVSCRHHLYLDVTQGGKLRINFPDLEPQDMPWACSLDIADAVAEGSLIPGGPTPGTLEAVGRALNVTKERARQLICEAKAEALARARDEDVTMTMADAWEVD